MLRVSSRTKMKKGEDKKMKGESKEEHLTKLPRSLLCLIFEAAIEDTKERRKKDGGRQAVRTLASLACTCRTLRDILFPETEKVVCDFHGLECHRQEGHHCHLNSDYPHSWYFDVEGYVCTDDMHSLTLGGKLWYLACKQMIGYGSCKLHAVCGAFTDDLCRENAIFWRNLCRDAAELRIMHWSKGANLVLKHNAKIEDDIMSRRMIADPEIVRAQKLLNISQTPRCTIPAPCKPCFSNAMLPLDSGLADQDYY